LCSPCKSNCKICSSISNCISCVSPLGLLNNDCFDPCPETYYLNDGYCISCKANCKTCIGSTDCTACIES